MQPANISIFCLMLFLNALLFSAFPVHSDKWTNDDMDVLKVLLQQLEESIPETGEITPYQAQMSENSYAKQSSDEPQDTIDQAKKFLSAKDLKAVRSNSSSKRYSGCFGRKMDRIGSVTNLGCKTLGKNSKSAIEHLWQ
ncbi:brain natriuretic peptide-like [Conger conger]|uniref:brain natriuretic peptide-like n=1 Tax=Conger conger TaxID=82655 RepID=UPI002A5983ED|nr:brain natriuretic peptide-like [Conger conger]